MSEPTNLNEALKMLRQGSEQPAEADVESAELAEEAGQEPAVGADNAGVIEEQEEDALPDGDDDNVGGLADLLTEADLKAQQEKLIKEAEHLAVDTINKQFEEQGWQRFGINDIVERDESTGRIRFRNPEDPNHDFQSRAEAQQWIDAYDKYFVSEWQNAVMEKRQEYLQESLPAMQMFQFVPTYQKMSKTEQEVFDAIIAGNEVTDSDGDTIGYSVNLNHAAQQARNIAAKFTAKEAKKIAAETQAAPANGPAVDMPSAGSSTAPEQKAPKNMNEAMKALRKGGK